jgi:hypothetical protein
LSYSTVTFQSPYGEIGSKWERKKKDVIYKVTIPPNATADFSVPSEYRLGKVRLSTGEVISLSEKEADVYTLVAGSYEIECKRKKAK